MIEAAVLFSADPSRPHADEKSSKHFQSLLRRTSIDTFWDALPGGLIWCLTIGARYSVPGTTRKWLLMQVTRLVWPLALDQAGEVLGGFRVVLRGLDALEEMWSGIHDGYCEAMPVGEPRGVDG
jgi:hypothetical protein